jgi:hypothetical protein
MQGLAGPRLFSQISRTAICLMVADDEPMDLLLPELIYAAHLLRAIGSRVPFPVALASRRH